MTLVTGAQGLILLCGLLKGVVGARLLSPAEFGLFVAAAATLSLLESVSRPGVHEAVVAAKKPPGKEATRALWTLLALRGFAIALGTFLLAPLIAGFLGLPGTVTPLRLMALVPLLRGAMSLEPVLRQRSLDVRLTTQMNAVAAISGLAGVAAGGLAFRQASGLALGLAFEALVRTAISYSRGGFHPRPTVAPAATRPYLRVAGWRTGSNIMTFAAMTVDDVVVARLAGPTAAGGYRLGYRLASAPTSEPVAVLGQIMLPRLSATAGGHPSHLRVDYRRYLVGTTAPVVVVATTLFATAPELVPLILGSEWLFVAEPMRVFLVGAVMRVIMATGAHAFVAAGAPKSDTAMQGARLVALLVGLFVAVPTFGLIGAAWASTGSVFIGSLVWARENTRLGITDAGTLGGLLRLIPLAVLSGAVGHVVSGALGLIAVVPAIAVGLAYIWLDKTLWRSFWWVVSTPASAGWR